MHLVTIFHNTPLPPPPPTVVNISRSLLFHKVWISCPYPCSGGFWIFQGKPILDEGANLIIDNFVPTNCLKMKKNWHEVTSLVPLDPPLPWNVRLTDFDITDWWLSGGRHLHLYSDFHGDRFCYITNETADMRTRWHCFHSNTCALFGISWAICIYRLIRIKHKITKVWCPNINYI